MATTLDAFLNAYAGQQDGVRPAVATVVRRLAAASLKIRRSIGQGALVPDLRGRHCANADGDIQFGLDLLADQAFFTACSGAPVAAYASEEREAPVLLDPYAPLAVAIDPLDGSSNIDTNISIGSIFSVLPAIGAPAAEPAAAFFQQGHRQLAAGFFIYGPQVALVLTLGSGTHVFIHAAAQDSFIAADARPAIPEKTQEFAINASNYRHWDEGVRLYIDDCLQGSEGPREKDFNMRWIASLVAETYRILMRGGIFLYPADLRKGYGRGRLRLVYEANPIAYLVEQAGGAATDTVQPILELMPESLHQRVPLVFGSKREVARLARYHTEPSMIAERSPFFGRRGLFRA